MTTTTTNSTTTASNAPPTPSSSSLLPSRTDPATLLESLDAFTSSRASLSATLQQQQQQQQQAQPSSSQQHGIDFINRHYSNEHVLQTQLPALLQAVADRRMAVQERISNALQRQSETSHFVKETVQEAQRSIQQLEQRIRLVQTKASQSERAVLEITRDLKRLDVCKRHLQKTITTLKRLHMLVHAVEQLRLACWLKPFANYKAASQLVEAINLLLQHFQLYVDKVPPMRLLQDKVDHLCQHLYNTLLRGFRIVAFGVTKTLELEDMEKEHKSGETEKNKSETNLTEEDDEEPNDQEDGTEAEDETVPIMPPSVLADGTLLITALAQQEQFMHTLCSDHLHAYEALFVPQIPQVVKQHSFKKTVDDTEKPQYSLDQVDRRFAFFRRLLRDLDQTYPSVFPLAWNFQYRLVCVFLERTKSHLLGLLDGHTKDKEAHVAAVLLKALQKTILFEKEMMAWLQRDYGTVFWQDDEHHKDETKTAVAAADLEFDDEGQAVAADSAQGIRIKYERQKRLKGDVMIVAFPPSSLDEPVPVRPLVGLASSAFDNYMMPYIALEEQSMDEKLVDALANAQVDNRGELPVFTTSTTLFVYMKGSITRCTAMTKGKAFFLLYQAFQDSLNKYAQVLAAKLPQPSVSSGGMAGIHLAGSFGKQPNPPPSTSASVFVIARGEEKTVSHVISTCEYCADTVEALEDLIRDTIDADYKERINMSTQQENFHDVTAKGITVLVSGLMTRIQGALKTMTDTNWAAFDMVGEESAYVRMIQSELVPFVATVRGLVPSSYFRSFCDKFATAFSTAYYDTLVRLKRINELGTQQLLLDAYNLKTSMLKLPVVEAKVAAKSSGGTTTSIAPAMYTKMVNKQFKRIETLLKLVGTPTNMLIDVFKTQWQGGSALDLTVVMSLKGLKRNDQANLLEKIGLDPQTALRGATAGVTSEELVAERMQELRQASTTAAAKVTSDLSQMRQKVDDFRKAFSG